MFRAVWNGVVPAESGRVVTVEGNHYFPPQSLHREYRQPNHQYLPVEGPGRNYHVRVDGKVNKDAAWYYPQTRPGASRITGHVAFWHGVRVEHAPSPSQEPSGTRRGLASRILGRLHRTGTQP